MKYMDGEVEVDLRAEHLNFSTVPITSLDVTFRVMRADDETRYRGTFRTGAAALAIICNEACWSKVYQTYFDDLSIDVTANINPAEEFGNE